MTKYYLLAALVQMLWSLTPSASQVVLQYLPVEAYAAIRFSISGLFFLGWLTLRGQRLDVKRADLPYLVLLGIATYGCASLGTLYGLKWGGVLNFALAASLNPIITAALAIVLLKEKVVKQFFVGVSLFLVGMLFLFLGKYELSNLSVAGSSLAVIFLAYCCEALGFVFSKRYQAKYSLPVYLTVLQLSGAAFLWGVTFATCGVPQGLLLMPPIAWVALGFVSIVSCGLCFLAFYWLLNFVEGHRLAFFDCFHILFAALFGVLFFGDTPNWKMGVGGILVIGSVMLITFPVEAVIARAAGPWQSRGAGQSHPSTESLPSATRLPRPPAEASQ